MYLKIMSGEDAPDDDPRKMFQMHDHVSTCVFLRRGKDVIAEVVFDDDQCETFEVPGNAFLMNAEGLTVASVGSAPYRKAA
jgi:hypothetical protein